MRKKIISLVFYRGPDWSGGDIDGGEGGVGTIVERIKPSSTSLERSVVIVRWDNGQQSQCFTGNMDAYALRVIDNATVGKEIVILWFDEIEGDPKINE